eukprot:5566933-Amphidinium_carterae.1
MEMPSICTKRKVAAFLSQVHRRNEQAATRALARNARFEARSWPAAVQLVRMATVLSNAMAAMRSLAQQCQHGSNLKYSLQPCIQSLRNAGNASISVLPSFANGDQIAHDPSPSA